MPARILAYGLLALLALGAAAGCCGCEAGYIARAGYEEMRLLWNRTPIDAELAHADLSPAVRRKLKTVLKVRGFAQSGLGLNVGGAYDTVTRVDRGAIVYVVMAAPRASLTPYTWWFPIVGRVPYRGYFNPASARAEAAGLEGRGFDTLVRPAIAFSSLGFFNDPLLSNLLALSRVELAGVIIHELFHRTFFLASDVMFDESAATYVGGAGAVEFFSATEGANSADAQAARGVLASDLKFAAFLQQQQAALLRLYQSGLPKGEILKRRVRLFDKIKSDYAALKPSLSGLERYDLDKQPLNNAVMLNYLIYFHDLDRMAALQRMHQGNLKETIKAIIALAKSEPGDPFDAIWKATNGAMARPDGRGAPTTAPAALSSRSANP